MKVSVSRKLSESEFHGHRHTEIWETLMKNSLILSEINISQDRWHQFEEELCDTLEQLVTLGQFHVAQYQGTVKIYFTNTRDLENARSYLSNH